VLIDSLTNDIPVIIGMPPASGKVGHAMVVTAIVYRSEAEGPRLYSVLVRDPDPTYRPEHGKRSLSVEEFMKVDGYILVTELGPP
jgi:hypothetical protein